MILSYYHAYAFALSLTQSLSLHLAYPHVRRRSQQEMLPLHNNFNLKQSIFS